VICFPCACSQVGRANFAVVGKGEPRPRMPDGEYGSESDLVSRRVPRLLYPPKTDIVGMDGLRPLCAMTGHS
jgi:hypothetical protein